jgi:hypothetical protein
MIIIGITGKKFHGKDTVADCLVTNYSFTKMAFADPLKEVCKTLFGFSDAQLYGKEKETKDPKWKITPRKAFQFIGTDLIRNMMYRLIPGIGKDFWVYCLMHKIDLIKESTELTSDKPSDESSDESVKTDKSKACAADAALPPSPVESSKKSKNIVISDVRFKNEAISILRRGGIIIKILRPDFDEEDEHESESQIDDIKPNFTIINNGTKEELAFKINLLISMIS